MLLIVELFQIFIFMVGLVGEKVGRKKIEKKKKKKKRKHDYFELVIRCFACFSCHDLLDSCGNMLGFHTFEIQFWPLIATRKIHFSQPFSGRQKLLEINN